MKRDKLTVFKTYHFELDCNKKIKKIMDHYSTYNRDNPFITASSLNDLSMKLLRYGSNISYKVPANILQSRLDENKIINELTKKEHSFIGQTRYFHESLSNKEKDYINTKTNQESINKKSEINNSLEDKLAEPGNHSWNYLVTKNKKS